MKTNTLQKAAFLLTVFSALAQARETNGTEERGSITDAELRYGINPGGQTLYIEGTNGWPEGGLIGDFEIPEAVTVNGVRMPVVGIGPSGFRSGYGGGNISGTVTIPSSIVSIGSKAFGNNTLSGIVIPDSVSYIGDSAFSECVNLSSFRIPASVEVIQEWTFYGCTALGDVQFHNGVTTIKYSAFASCAALLDPVFPTELITIESKAFENCASLTSLTLPSKLRVIGYDAFAACHALRSVLFPASVTSLGTGSFNPCLNLSTVTFRGGLPDHYKAISNGDNTQLVTIICKAGVGFEQAFDDKSEYRILYSTPYAELQNHKGKTLKNGAKVNWGVVPVDSKGQTIKLRVKNLGSKALKLKWAKLTGSQRRSFAVVSKVPSSIGAGRTATIKVRFKPLTTSKQKSILKIKCNDPTKKTLKLQLFGKGA